MLFTKQLSIGNRTLDSEHKRLLEIAEDITRSITTDDAVALQETFNQMEGCLHAYFAAKESFAHAVGFDFARQRQVQRNLLEKVMHIRNVLSGDKDLLSEREKSLLARALNDHLLHHFIVDCRPLKFVLDTHYYDFMPDSAAFA